MSDYLQNEDSGDVTDSGLDQTEADVREIERDRELPREEDE